MTEPRGGGRSWAPYFPLPLVGAAVLLAVLIVLTPNLLSTGTPSAGSIESQAELLIDRSPTGSNVTHLYVRGLGLARFHSIVLAWTPLPAGPLPSSLGGLSWTNRIVGADVLSLEDATSASSFAVNATAVYIDSAGAGATFSGGFAFRWDGTTLDTMAYGSASGANPAPIATLPLVLLLPQEP